MLAVNGRDGRRPVSRSRQTTDRVGTVPEKEKRQEEKKNAHPASALGADAALLRWHISLTPLAVMER